MLSQLSIRSAKSRNPQNLDRPTTGGEGSLGEKIPGSAASDSWPSLGWTVGDSIRPCSVNRGNCNFLEGDKFRQKKSANIGVKIDM